MDIQDIKLTPEEKNFVTEDSEESKLADKATLKALNTLKDTIHDIMVAPTSAGRKLFSFDELETNLKSLIKSMEGK